MKRIIVASLFILASECFAEEPKDSLRYESMGVSQIVCEVLNVGDFGRGDYSADLDAISRRFPRGMARTEVYRELVEVKARYLYCTEIFGMSDKEKITFRVFRFPSRTDRVLKEEIDFAFTFAEEKLLDISFSRLSLLY